MHKEGEDMQRKIMGKMVMEHAKVGAFHGTHIGICCIMTLCIGMFLVGCLICMLHMELMS